MTMKKILLTVIGTVAVIAAGGAIVVATGLYDVAADDPHTASVSSFLTMAREESIARRATNIKVPDLASNVMIEAGAKEYSEMCVGCHLAPGSEGMDLRPGLNPQPPDLTKLGVKDPARTFWIIKHGIKMTGMPAWGVNHDDETLWSLVAFLNRLPGMTQQQYAQLAGNAEPDTHSHGSTMDAHHGSDQAPAKPHQGHTHTHGKQPHQH